ncbi:MAG: cob(I)yrinic acid a,c-diamide adenosyltransferase [Eubacteriales bacterium]|nr:cob(I)yrinic acid a,c-diamide adenosyltransferase [Eubacteriales bacterium]
MSIYTKGGDKGTTSLVHTKNVSKSDDRIHLVGTIDELTSHIGLVKTMLSDKESVSLLEEVQRTLIQIMAGVADPYNREYRVGDGCTEELESAIDRLEASFDRPKRFVLPGGSQISAELDITRTVARRAERAMAAVGVKFGADQGAKGFLNRLADYLYMLARYEDARAEGREREAQGEGAGFMGAKEEKTKVSQAVVQEVLKRMGIQGRITLKGAKALIEKIEEEARRRGKQAVIAVCGPDGNPIAVHVMDGAFLVSFDVAVKKAYTSVAVKMSTQELSRLAQPGQTFFGLDKMGEGKIVIFGGGVPLKVGDTIIGGLGVSGGTGEEDHSLAEYGLSVLEEVL